MMSKYAFGVDVGGTTVKLGLFNDEGQVLDKWEIPTVKDNGGEKVLPDIAASIKNKMQEKNITAADLVGVGIGAPGAVNADGFMVNGAVNIGHLFVHVLILRTDNLHPKDSQLLVFIHS